MTSVLETTTLTPYEVAEGADLSDTRRKAKPDSYMLADKSFYGRQAAVSISMGRRYYRNSIISY
jgi:hypothetical protein